MQPIVDLFVTSPDKFLILGSISLAALLFAGILLAVYYKNDSMVKVISTLSIVAMLVALAMGNYLPFPEEELAQLRRRNFELGLEVRADGRRLDDMRQGLRAPIARADTQIAVIEGYLLDPQRLINRADYQTFLDDGFFDDYQFSVKEGVETFDTLLHELRLTRDQLSSIGAFDPVLPSVDPEIIQVDHPEHLDFLPQVPGGE